MSVGIIGQGRFGKLLANLVTPHFSVKVCDKEISADVLTQETVFVAVPIRHFESVIKEIAPNLGTNSTIIDVCSVKVIPTQIMQNYLPKNIDIIASHPLFGPDSVNTNYRQKIMLASIRDQYDRFATWKQFFQQHSIDVIEMTPDQHDRYMAESQNLTHLIGRALAEINAKPTPVNTAGFNQLLTIMQHTCNDSLELFYDLQRFNPYSQETSKKLIAALTKLSNPPNPN